MTNQNTAAIVALAQAVDAMMLKASHDTAEAREYASQGNVNATVGTIIGLRENLEAAVEMCRAIERLQKLRLHDRGAP